MTRKAKEPIGQLWLARKLAALYLQAEACESFKERRRLYREADRLRNSIERNRNSQ